MTGSGWHCLTETATDTWSELSEHGASQPYFHLVAQGIFGLVLDRFGGGRGPDARLFFTLNADLKMDAPLHAGRELKVHIQPIRRTEKVIETGISIMDASSTKAIAFCHHTGAFIHAQTRRIDLLGELATRLWDEQAAIENHVETLEPMEDRPRGKNGIRTLEGKIEVGWIDRMGHMGIEHYGLILDRAGENARRTLTPALACGLPRRIQVRYLKEIQLGQPYYVLSWISESAGRPLRIEHELWAGTPDAPEALAARCQEDALRLHP